MFEVGKDILKHGFAGAQNDETTRSRLRIVYYLFLIAFIGYYRFPCPLLLPSLRHIAVFLEPFCILELVGVLRAPHAHLALEEYHRDISVH